ncbi:MAG: FAD-dependent monooxygenase [Alphaproteobacteria bacterium]|nr:FAD-dependent monooxygenase [Alphaproteobacteria bacterium]
MEQALIIGAGPVGLTMALELARRGIPPRIVDRADGPPRESRAIGVNPRSLDILDPAGVTDLILAEGQRIDRARLMHRGRTVGCIEFGRLDHRFPFMTALAQRRTQQILEARLNEMGVRVERGVTFEGLSWREGMALARLRSAAGMEECATRRLIGCDGAHSAVRQSAGIAFEGRAFEHDWSLMDAEIDWPLPQGEVVLDFSPAGTLFSIPLGDGIRRLVRNGPAPEALLPATARLGRVLWRSDFRISHRLARKFRAGAVFLAGDAAHIHSPAGARGMNGGIEDAATLAWLVAEGREEIYESLRRPAAARVLRQVDRQTRQADQRGGALLGLRLGIAGLALRAGPLQRLAARFITALDTPMPVWLDKSGGTPRSRA